MAAQRKPQSSRATATVATVSGLPLRSRWRWRWCRRICAPGAGERLRRHVPLVGAEASGEAGRVLVVPGRLDQQAAGVLVAGLGGRAALAALAGGVLADGQAEEAHQLARRAEAAEVAE